jgi:hypothetical protein
MSSKILEELRRDLEDLRKRERHPGKLEIIRTFSEAAEIIGCSRMSLYRYRQIRPDFPPLPAFKASILQWRKSFFLRKGPQPSQHRKIAVYLRGEGFTFAEIGRRLGINRSSARGLVKRHQIWKQDQSYDL